MMLAFPTVATLVMKLIYFCWNVAINVLAKILDVTQPFTQAPALWMAATK
jgi:hypothetical protein